jgi:hypothetical protein
MMDTSNVSSGKNCAMVAWADNGLNDKVATTMMTVVEAINSNDNTLQSSASRNESFRMAKYLMMRLPLRGRSLHALAALNDARYQEELNL